MDVKIARWIGRGLCLVLFILWGAFFIEHLGFFMMSSGELPPLYVWALQFVHLLLLISYLLVFKYERVGSLGIFVFALIFFFATAAEQAPLFIIISISPILFFAYGWIRNRWMDKPSVS